MHACGARGQRCCSSLRVMGSMPLKCIIKMPFAKSHVSASVRSGLAAQHGSCRLLSLPAAGDCMRAPGNAYPKKPTRHSTELNSGIRRYWHHAPKQRRQERLARAAYRFDLHNIPSDSAAHTSLSSVPDPSHTTICRAPEGAPGCLLRNLVCNK